jgi:energy-coupling factor transporter ATP-binding protein EcfA2
VIGGSALETYRVVTTRGFNDLRDEVLKRLDDEGVVVLVGPRGIGKTTLATYVTWTLLREGGLRFMVNVKDIEEVGDEFTGFIGYYLDNKYDDKYGNLLVVYDPSTTKTYSRADKKTEVPKGISNTIDTLLKSIAEDEKVRGRVRLLMVLPTDIYQALPQDLRDRLGKYILNLEEKGFLKDPEFLAEVIREYARGCRIDYGETKELAREILGRFSEGYTLIARLAGTLIASRYGCKVEDVERIIEESGGNAHYFILRYINGLFKVDENSDVTKTLAEIFALRRPFVDSARPGDPILTPGIVELIGEEKRASLLQSAKGEELRSWLAIRQHDLIEDSIGELLRCIVNESKECKEKLGTSLKPWRLRTVRKSLREISEKVRDEVSAVKYFVSSYGEKLTEALKDSSNCWRRATLIIGYASAGHPIVPRPEDLPSDVVGSLGDALGKCEEIDNYLLVGGKIPPLIMNLTKDHAYALAGAFIDKYDEAVVEVRRILNVARGRDISDAEKFYGLGLASIIANAAGSNKPIKPSDADAALHIALFAIQDVASLDLIKPVLGALRPLRDYAPHRYLELLAHASSIENLDSGTVEYILNDELNYVLNNYGDVVKGYAWSLVHAIIAYAYLLWVYRSYFDDDEVKGVVGRVADLLNELGKFKSSLGVIARAYALAPALNYEDVRRPMEEKLGINVVDKASEVLGELGRLRDEVQDLMRDEEFMNYIESKYIKADEGAVRKEILETASLLKSALAMYRFGNDELDEAEDLFNEVAGERREIGDYENDLVARGLALRVEAIEGSLVSKKLVGEFRRLYEETFSKEHFKPTARYLSIASLILGNYLVSLALTGDDKKINELLEEHLWVLNADKQVSVLTRLMLNALLGHRVGLSGKLEGKLGVNPGELINAFETDMHSEFLPALRVAFGKVGLEDGYEECKSKRRDCRGAVLAAADDSDAIWWLRWKLIYNFNEQISEKEKSGWLRKLGFDANVLINEFKGLVNGLDGKSLAQLIAPGDSVAQFVLMLHALINGNKELARAHALYGAVVTTGSKLVSRLSLKAYRACCDLKRKRFRCAIVKRFFYHV